MITLLVWWLLVSGSFLNLIIYTLLNDSMKRSLVLSWRMLGFKMGLRKEDPTLAAAATSNKPSSAATKTTSLVNQTSVQQQQQSANLLKKTAASWGQQHRA